MSSVYKINKGINKPVEFKGLKAQYIWILGGGLVALLILFALLYIVGVNVIVCLLLVIVFGAILFFIVYRFNDKYGEYGMMKKIAARWVPKSIRSNTRRTFFKKNM